MMSAAPRTRTFPDARAALLAAVLLSPAWAKGLPEPDWKLDVEWVNIRQEVREESELNPKNTLAAFPEFLHSLYLRPQVGWRAGFLRADARPRAAYGVSWAEGPWRDRGRVTTAEFYLQEWQVAATPGNGVFAASYGREVVQWGPSLFLSPSNVFFNSNGKSNPFEEQGAMDFAKASLLFPNASMHLISNVFRARGERIYPEFSRTHALKLDFMSERTNSALVGAWREQGGEVLMGGYSQATVNDALLVYADVLGRDHSPGRYPVRDAASPTEWAFEESRLNGGRLSAQALAGLSYTFVMGPSVSLEYFHNTEGYDAAEARDYRAAVSAGSRLMTSGGPLSPAGAGLLAEASDLRLRSLRRNYLHLQYLHTNVAENLSLTGRATWNMDDRGGEVAAIINYYLGERIRLALLVPVFFGPSDAESRRWLDYLVFSSVKIFL